MKIITNGFVRIYITSQFLPNVFFALSFDLDHEREKARIKFKNVKPIERRSKRKKKHFINKMMFFW